MRQSEFEIGKKIGRLTIVSEMYAVPAGLDKDGYQKTNKHVDCRCECGTEKSYALYSLGKSAQSCGCKKIDDLIKRRRKYDKKYKEYLEAEAHSGIKKRCYNKESKSYPNYGGRGIIVCDRWLDKENGFKNFLEDMGRKPSPKHSIDRIDVDGNYCPENCRWATHEEQSDNKRNTIYLVNNGERKSLNQWAKFYDVPILRVRSRYHAGFDFDRIFKKQLFDTRFKPGHSMSRTVLQPC